MSLAGQKLVAALAANKRLGKQIEELVINYNAMRQANSRLRTENTSLKRTEHAELSDLRSFEQTVRVALESIGEPVCETNCKDCDDMRCLRGER